MLRPGSITNRNGVKIHTDEKSGAPLLVTTAIEETWGGTGPIAFLGEWCRLYDRRDAWGRRPHSVVSYHWDDRNKLRADHDHLKSLRDALLADLARVMNECHRIERPLRYWRMILDPWLLTYVAVIWDRWECLRLAFEEHRQLRTISLDSIAGSKPCLDYDDFIEKSRIDSWNYQLYLEIIKSNYRDRCGISPATGMPASVADLDARLSFTSRPHSVKYRIAGFLDSLLRVFSARNKAVFFESYFPLSALARLNLSLGQLPRLYLREFNWKISVAEASASVRQSPLRKSISFSFEPKNAFEAFLLQRIAGDIPFVYMEGYAPLRARAAQIGMKPKVILTANAHWNNALFKLWSAEQIMDGAKFVSLEHGGGLYPSLCAMLFEEDIADIKTTWAIPFHSKQTQLPPNKRGKVQLKSTREQLAVVGCEISRYAYRADSAPKAGQNLIGCNMVCDLYSLLADEIKNHFLVKPFPDQGWNTRQRFIDRLGMNRVSTEPDYYRFLSRARVVVCTYPQTTFSEAMASGIPTIVFYPADLWEIIPQHEPLLEMLRAAKIAFHAPQAAADHINLIWGDPQRWWNSAEVLHARNEFHRLASALDSDWLKQWTTFVEGVAA